MALKVKLVEQNCLWMDRKEKECDVSHNLFFDLEKKAIFGFEKLGAAGSKIVQKEKE